LNLHNSRKAPDCAAVAYSQDARPRYSIKLSVTRGTAK
jgi:hypothetical protein